MNLREDIWIGFTSSAINTLSLQISTYETIEVRDISCGKYGGIPHAYGSSHVNLDMVRGPGHDPRFAIDKSVIAICKRYVAISDFFGPSHLLACIQSRPRAVVHTVVESAPASIYSFSKSFPFYRSTRKTLVEDEVLTFFFQSIPFMRCLPLIVHLYTFIFIHIVYVARVVLYINTIYIYMWVLILLQIQYNM